MDAAADAIIENILKKQNAALIKRLSKDFNLDEKLMLQKYHTPSFYGLVKNNDKIYKILFTSSSETRPRPSSASSS